MTTDTVVVDVSQDWASACDVQQGFMNCKAPTLDTLSYGARCRQLRALGDDSYDFVPLPGNRLAIAIGDASGKSLSAALMIANVQSSLRTAAFFAGNDPAAVLDTVTCTHLVSRIGSRHYFMEFSTQPHARCGTPMEAIILLWWFGETARSFGSTPPAFRSDSFRIRRTRKARFGCIQAIQ